MDTGPAIQSDTAIQTGPAIQSDAAIRGRQSSALSSYKWPIVGLTLWMLAIAVSALFDQRLSDIAAAGLVHERLEWIVLIGGGIGGFAILPALLGSFPNRKRVMVGFVAALLLSTVVTHALKFVIGRARPLAGNGSALEAAPLSFQNLMDAFPSGHAAAGLTIAILLGLYYPHARAYFYLIAVCIMTERVVNGWHYPTDTLAGAAIAIAAVALCYRGLGGSYFRRDIPRPGH